MASQTYTTTPVVTSLGGEMDTTFCDQITVTGVVEHVHQPTAVSNEVALFQLRVEGLRI